MLPRICSRAFALGAGLTALVRCGGASVDAGATDASATADGGAPDGTHADAPACEGSACATLIHRHFDVVRMLVGPDRLIVRSGGLQASFAYGSGSHGIYMLPFDGEAATPLIKGPGLGAAMALAPPWLYGCSGHPSNPEVSLWRAPYPGGGAPSKLVDSACFGVAASSSDVFFTTPDGVLRLPLAGGTPSVVATTLGAPEAIELDGSRVYWSHPGGIQSLPLGGGAVANLAVDETVSEWAGLDLDDTHVYWVNGDDDTARRVAKTGGPPETVSGTLSCTDVAVDDAFVYCTNENRLVRLDKGGGGSVEVIAGGFHTSAELVVVAGSAVYFTVDGAYVPTQFQEADQIYRIDLD